MSLFYHCQDCGVTRTAVHENGRCIGCDSLNVIVERNPDKIPKPSRIPAKREARSNTPHDPNKRQRTRTETPSASQFTSRSNRTEDLPISNDSRNAQRNRGSFRGRASNRGRGRGYQGGRSFNPHLNTVTDELNYDDRTVEYGLSTQYPVVENVETPKPGKPHHKRIGLASQNFTFRHAQQASLPSQAQSRGPPTKSSQHTSEEYAVHTARKPKQHTMTSSPAPGDAGDKRFTIEDANKKEFPSIAEVARKEKPLRKENLLTYCLHHHEVHDVRPSTGCWTSTTQNSISKGYREPGIKSYLGAAQYQTFLSITPESPQNHLHLSLLLEKNVMQLDLYETWVVERDQAQLLLCNYISAHMETPPYPTDVKFRNFFLQMSTAGNAASHFLFVGIQTLVQRIFGKFVKKALEKSLEGKSPSVAEARMKDILQIVHAAGRGETEFKDMLGDYNPNAYKQFSSGVQRLCTDYSERHRALVRQASIHTIEFIHSQDASVFTRAEIQLTWKCTIEVDCDKEIPSFSLPNVNEVFGASALFCQAFHEQMKAKPVTEYRDGRYVGGMFVDFARIRSTADTLGYDDDIRVVRLD